MTETRQNIRYLILATLILAVWSGLAARLFYLHLGPNEALHARIKGIREIEQSILVGRGRIMDRNGQLMAMDLHVKHVWVDPKTIKEKGHGSFISQQLGRLLHMDPAIIAARVELPGREYEIVKKFVKEDEAAQIKHLGLDGVHFDDVSQRNYPLGSLACQVLGFSNHEGHGAFGVELQFDRQLRGAPGMRRSELNGRRIELYTHRFDEVKPQEGSDVYLTIDQNLQYFAECALERAIERTRAKSAWAIVQEVRTGRILAMASLPAFNPNNMPKKASEALLNRVISYGYEPGSTFKVAVIAAALNDKTVTPATIFDCEMGKWKYGGRTLGDFHNYGLLNVADVLKESSNIGAAKIGLTLGPERLHHYLSEFGFGRKTGVELPNEVRGILWPAKKWDKYSMTSVPMGHEVRVNSLQMISMVSAIANRGFLMKPIIIDRVINTKGETVNKGEPIVQSRPISEETARLMTKLLTRVTEPGGTAEHVRPEGFTVAGKTGTAEKFIDGHYSKTLNISSFVGFLPAERPEITIMVVVDEPHGAVRTGGWTAGPAFKEIAEQAMRHLDIPPVPEEQAFHFGDAVPVQEI